MLATVRNKKGQVIGNLTKDDFVLEDNGRVQPITYFVRDTDLPLTLGLLVDTSLSERRMIDQERSASRSFFDQVLRPENDQAFVIHFDREVELLQDLTSSREKLQAALDNLQTPSLTRTSGSPPSSPGPRVHGQSGGTTLYDAVFLASDELMKKQHGRKALVVLSDGVDTGSKVSIDRAIEAAQRADALVYSVYIADEQFYNRGFGGSHIGMGGGRGGWGGMGRRGRYPQPEQERPDGKKILERISKETGGRFFEVSRKTSVDEIYRQIQEELRSQYSLGFTPNKPDATPGYHKLHLAVKQKGLLVQARDGYYLEE